MSTIEHAIEGTITAPGSDAQAIIDHVNATATPRELEPGLVYLITDADGEQRIIDTDTYADAPRNYERDVAFHDPESLIAYIQRHATHQNGVEVWITPGTDGQTPAVRAVLDANAWRAHTARVLFEQTPEWRDWLNISGQILNQEKFAEFIEDHVDDILTPSGADMLELAQSIRAKSHSTFKSDRRLASGQVQVEYTENIDAQAGKAGSITIPDEITLKLAPFQGAKTYRITAKFRYRLGGGSLGLGVKVLRPEAVIQAVLDDTHDTIAQGLPGALVVLGRP